MISVSYIEHDDDDDGCGGDDDNNDGLCPNKHES